MPAEVRDEAHRMSGRTVEHAHGTWRPSLSRNPTRVLSHAHLDAQATSNETLDPEP